MVEPILLYVFEVWGIEKRSLEELEKVKTEFMKWIVGVRRSVTTTSLWQELEKLLLEMAVRYGLLNSTKV